MINLSQLRICSSYECVLPASTKLAEGLAAAAEAAVAALAATAVGALTAAFAPEPETNASQPSAGAQARELSASKNRTRRQV